MRGFARTATNNDGYAEIKTPVNPGDIEWQRIFMNRELAEGEGFEPSIRFPAYTLSKRAPSATRPPLREVGNIPEDAGNLTEPAPSGKGD